MNQTQFFVELKEELTTRDFSNLRLLYTPLVGATAVMFFQLLYDYFALNKENKAFYLFSELARLLNISLLELEQNRKKLEATGLIRTFEKANNQAFILRLNRPLAPFAFRQNKFLFRRAVARTSEVFFERVEFSQRANHTSKDDYAEITCKYQDLFGFDFGVSSNDNTLEIALPSARSKTEAVAQLTTPQFVFYLTKTKVSPSQLQLFQDLQNRGLSSKALNTIVDYSFTINGRVVGNHIRVIANDLVAKDIKDATSIAMELQQALQSKALQNKQSSFQKPVATSDEDQDWHELFESLGGL